MVTLLLMLQAGPVAEPPKANDNNPIQEVANSLLSAAQDWIRKDNGDTLTLRLQNVDVFNALEMLSEQTHEDIIVHNDVTGQVNLLLRRVSFEQALDAMLSANRLMYERRDGIIHVFPQPPEPERPAFEPVTRIFRLNHIAAADAVEFIQPLVGSDVVIAATKSATGGLDAEEGETTPAGNDVIGVVGPEHLVELVELALREIDRKPAQVLVEATIMRATLNDQNALGIDFNTLMGVDFQIMTAASPGLTTLTLGPLPANEFDDTSATVQTDFAASIPPGGFTFGIVKDQVAGFVRALERITDVTIMANPKVLTLNKQRGEVIVGRRDGFITTTVTETAAVQTVEYLETGTKLVFRPHVTGDGYVRMEVHPEDSNGGLTAANLPFQETTEATTNVLLKDGHTILIGGLFRERTTAAREQTPLIGNVPFVGALFGVSQDQTVREEVIILLTVHVLDDLDQQDGFEHLEDDIERFRVGARRGLMGTGREQMAQARFRAAVGALDEGDIDRALSNLRMTLHLNPRHTDAIKLKEQLENKRTWSISGSIMRSYLREHLNEHEGDPRRPVFGEPDIPAMLRDATQPEPDPSTGRLPKRPSDAADSATAPAHASDEAPGTSGATEPMYPLPSDRR